MVNASREEQIAKLVAALNDDRDARLRRWAANDWRDEDWDVDAGFRHVAGVVLDTLAEGQR